MDTINFKNDINLHYYIHRVKGKLVVSKNTPLSPFRSKLTSVQDKQFVINESKVQLRNFQTSSPIENRLSIEINTTKNNKSKHWGYIDTISNAIHIDGEFPKQIISDFKHLFQRNSIHVDFDYVEYSYVEICCRYPFSQVSNVVNVIEKLIPRFNTLITEFFLFPLSDGNIYQYIAKNLYLDGYFNLKTYYFVSDFNTPEARIDLNREPKLEIQIHNPVTIQRAIEKGVPILKSVINYLGIQTIPMNKSYELSDYTFIPNQKKYTQNPKLGSFLNQQTENTLPCLPDVITKNKSLYKVVCYCWYEGKSTKQVLKDLKISSTTLTRIFKELGGIVERRGDRKNGYLYFIDKTSFNNIYNKRSISSIGANKDKAISAEAELDSIFSSSKNIFGSFSKTSINMED